MIEKELKVGDHIVDTEGHIYIIDAVNKASYRAKSANGGYYPVTVPFDGMRREYGFVYEYFVCDDVQLKIIESLKKENKSLQQKLDEQNQNIFEAQTLKENLDWLCKNHLSDFEKLLDDD